MTLYITFMRHAESEGNRKRIVQGQLDLPLTEDGLSQVQELAAKWKAEGVEFDEIFCSSLTRTRQSAEPIAKAINAKISYLDEIMERGFGNVEGIPGDEYFARLQEARSSSPFIPNLGIGAGESEWEINQRAGDFLRDLTQKPAGSYLVVSHGGFLNVLLRVIFGLPPTAAPYGHHFGFKNLGRLTTQYDPERGHWAIFGFY